VSLTVLVPKGSGLAADQNYIPELVQGEFVSNFSNYSAISILDWERLDDIYVKLTAEEYDDKAEAKQDVVLGRLAPTSHFLTGNITKTATGYNIKMNITATADKMTVATYSGALTFAELDNLTGVRRASVELLQKVGVELTEKARQELAGAAEANQISAQKALARGVTAQRAGTEVAALSYYFQAASFNPALKEAVKRSTIVAANISSGNIGADIRNDIVWRKNWVARLKETEETFYEIIEAAIDPPYTLTYFTEIKTGKIDYQTETAELGITIDVSANGTWFAAMRQALVAAQTVLDGLNATKRKNDWDLKRWPWTSVSNTNPFISEKQYDITVVFELVNQQGLAIGSETVELRPRFSIKSNNRDQFMVVIAGDGFSIVNFEGVNANNISDNLTIRVASVNGAPPEEARFTIVAMPLTGKAQPLIDTRNGKKYNTVRIGGKTWMAENLNYQPKTGNSACHGNNNSNCNKYGRLYDWNTALNVCPIGWHLPNTNEWKYLVTLIGEREAGIKLKTKSGWNNNGNGMDDYGFSALPSGNGYFHKPNPFVRNSGQPSFGNLGEGAFWWTATAYEYDSGKAKYRYVYYNNKDAAQYETEKESAYSVRCIQD